MLHASAVLSTTGLGGLYFISAPSAGIALGLRWPLAALFAWTGYSTAGAVVTTIGTSARGLISRKIKIEPDRAKNRIFWACWNRAGLFGVGLISPVTIGPKVAAVMGLAMGERPVRLALAISLGAVPWALGLALATSWGFSLIH